MPPSTRHPTVAVATLARPRHSTTSGCLSQLITENVELFHQEKDTLLNVGLKLSPYVQTDDTGARHKGKNGYCTSIDELFSWFASAESKRRINFLSLLKQGVNSDYVVNVGALDYMARQLNDLQEHTVAQVREFVWAIYRHLKAYPLQPNAESAQLIR